MSDKTGHKILKGLANVFFLGLFCFLFALALAQYNSNGLFHFWFKNSEGFFQKAIYYKNQALNENSRSKRQMTTFLHALDFMNKATHAAPTHYKYYWEKASLLETLSAVSLCAGIELSACPVADYLKRSIQELENAHKLIIASPTVLRKISQQKSTWESVLEKHSRVHLFLQQMSKKDAEIFSDAEISNIGILWEMGRLAEARRLTRNEPPIHFQFDDLPVLQGRKLRGMEVSSPRDPGGITRVSVKWDSGKSDEIQCVNWLYNSSFEWSKDKEKIPVGWEKDLYDTYPYSRRVALDPETGKQFLVLDNDSAQMNVKRSSAVSKRFPVQGGALYFQAGRIKRTGVGGSIQIAWFDSRGEIIEYPGFSSAGIGKWCTVGNWFRAPKNAAYCEIWLINYESPSACYFDDIVFLNWPENELLDIVFLDWSESDLMKDDV